MGIPGLQYPTLHGPVHTPDNNRWDTSPCIQLQILGLCNFTNSVHNSSIQTLK